MNEIIFQVEEADEGGYTAHALRHSIFTEAESMEELRNNVRDAVRCHFDECSGPRVIRLHFAREEVLVAWGCRGTSIPSPIAGTTRQREHP